MKLGNTKLFHRDRKKLYEAVNLRLNGWALTSLAFLYDCDISSLRAQCAKYAISPPEKRVYTMERITSRTLLLQNPVKTKWTVRYGEKICLGRSYRDYLIK